MSKTEKVVAYKAFNEDMTCRGFKYEAGKTYEHEGRVGLCSGGFHACLVPFTCWDYYPGSTSFARVIYPDGVSDEKSEDSKVVGAKITIEASLSLSDWARAQAEAVIGLCQKAKKSLASADYECAAATGYSGHAAATGDGGHAAATGDGGHAVATGYSGHAAATGYSCHAAATGYRGHAAATGNRGHAAATGYSGHAVATGKEAIAAAFGVHGTAKAGPDGWVVLAAHYNNRNLVCVKAAKVGGPEGVKAGVTYRLTAAGEFVEV